MAQIQGSSGIMLEYPQHLAFFDRYDEAQRAVDYLSDQKFPVQNCLIVGTDLKQVERVTGRMTWGKAAGYGAATGAWFGLLLGLIVGIFAEPGSWLSIVISAALFGVVFGVIWGLLGYALSGGKRDFTSVSQVVASRYELLVEHRFLAQAQQVLGGTGAPGAPTGAHAAPAPQATEAAPQATTSQPPTDTQPPAAQPPAGS